MLLLIENWCSIKMTAQIPIGDNVLDFPEGTYEVYSNDITGKSSDSQQLSDTFCTRENESLTPVDAQDLSGADAVVAAFESFCIEELSIPGHEEAKDIIKFDDIRKSSSLCDDRTKETLKVNTSVESFTVKEKENSVIVDGASEIKGLFMTSSSPCRQSTFKEKLDQSAWDKRPIRNCRRKANKKVLLDLSCLQITRGRRSSLCKRSRSTAWGLLSNIASLPKHSGGLDVILDDTKRSSRRRGVQVNGKRENKMTAGSSQKLKKKRHTPTGPISLKVKFGKQTASSVSIIPVRDDKKEEHLGSENFSCELPKDANGLVEEVHDSLQFQSADGNSEKASGIHLSFKDTIGSLDRNTADDLCDSPFCEVIDNVGANDNRVLDSGTSPDSEVINVLPDPQTSRKDSEELHHVLIPSNGFSVPRKDCDFILPWQCSEQERKQDELHETGGFYLKREIPSPVNLNEVQEFETLREIEKMGDGSCSSDDSTSTSTLNASVLASNIEVFIGEPLPSSAGVEFGNCCAASNVEGGTEGNLSLVLDEQRESKECLLSQRLLPSLKDEKLNKNSGAKKVTKSKSETRNFLSRSEKASKKKGIQDKSARKSKKKETAVSDQSLQKVENLPKTGTNSLH